MENTSKKKFHIVNLESDVRDQIYNTFGRHIKMSYIVSRLVEEGIRKVKEENRLPSIK